MLQSQLFQGDAILQAVADDRARISRTENNLPEPVGKVQQALLIQDPTALPRFGADGIYGDETAEAVVRFKRDELGVPEAEIIDDVGPRTVIRLDEIALAEENGNGPQPPTGFTRRDVWTLEPTDAWHPTLLAYAHGVRVMQGRPPADPTSWTFQAALHGTFQRPALPTWNACQHGNWFFLPWHRMYLFFFERIVRAAAMTVVDASDFALPYWDYEKAAPANSLPLAFRRLRLPDGVTRNPLFVPAPGRRGVVNDGTFVFTPQLISSAGPLNQLVYIDTFGTGFGGGARRREHFSPDGTTTGIESMPHNLVHGAIGGRGDGLPQCGVALMSDPNCAALDPIFWLHHANIDRRWSQWLALGNGRVNPSDTPWRNERFDFHDENGTTVTMTANEVLDTATQLNYVYDDVAVAAPPTPVFPIAAPTPEEGIEAVAEPELVGSTETTMEITNEAVSLPLVVPDLETESVRSLVAEPSRVLIVAEDIQADLNAGIAYAVYLNLPDDGNPETLEKHRIGLISLFGIETLNDPDREHAGTPGLRHTFDVTELVQTLTNAGTWDPASITVTIEPIDVMESTIAEEAPAARMARMELPTVRVGRVSLFVG